MRYILSFLVIATSLWAQEDMMDYSAPKTYQIGGIDVIGDNKLDNASVLLLTGLSIGDDITIPGDETKDIVQRFYNQGLFSYVGLFSSRIEDNYIFLELRLDELPKISKFAFHGLTKSEVKDVKEELELRRSTPISKELIPSIKRKISTIFYNKGYYNASVEVAQKEDETMANGKILDIYVKKRGKVRIDEISVDGNTAFTDRYIRKKLKNTKEKRWYRFWKRSKYIENDFEIDQGAIVDIYNSKGYRDAYISKDTIYQNEKGNLVVDMELSEGEKYYFRNISWSGNTKYSSEDLTRFLGIKKGDVYDEQLLTERLEFSMAGTDIKSLYMDDGYLFFQLDPVETAIVGDSIDLEMRMFEGKQAYIRNVIVKGNTKTRDDVIYREIRTLPGQLFRRSDIIRTQEALIGTKYFNPQSFNIQPKPDPQTGMVDIEYTVEEQSVDQIQFQAAFGGGRLFGTLALNLNNFSLRKARDKKAWQPLPSGDGQKLNLNFTSSGADFQSYGVSFIEPWLGGRKPNSLSVGFNQFRDQRFASDVTSTRVFAGLGKRLRWPDDYFTLNQTVTLQRYNVRESTNAFFLKSGRAHNVNYRIALTRNSVFQPFYPTRGSTFSLSGEFTPPYSVFEDVDYRQSTIEDISRWVEYYKIRFKSDWYTNPVSKLVLNSHIEVGTVNAYNSSKGLSPFERFNVGGDGLQGGGQAFFDGSEPIRLRGYQQSALNPQGSSGETAASYLRYYLEMRYPLIENQQSTIYGLAFAEAGNGFAGFSDFDAFDIKRSAGVGFRVIIPILGILGVDFAYGFDSDNSSTSISGWQTHLVLGQQL